MQRRSRRLSGKKALANGDISDEKKARMDDDSMATDNNNIGEGTNTVVQELRKHRGTLRKAVLKDVPLKERRKTEATNSSATADDAATTNATEPVSMDVEMSDKTDEQATTVAATTAAAAGGDPPNEPAESLAVLLVQGLISNDAEKIDAVLSNGDARIISATVGELPSVQILPLLKALQDRCKNRTHLKSSWIRWMRYIFSKHMVYLTTIRTLKDELSLLTTWMDKMTSNMNLFLEMHGKLTLVNEQINRRMHPQTFASQQPVISFEGDSETPSESSSETHMDEGDESSTGSIENWWDDEAIVPSGEESAGDGAEEESWEDEDEDDDEMVAGEDH